MIAINTPNDLIKLLKAKKIQPKSAEFLYSKMRGMIPLVFTETEPPTAEEVINQIKHLETLESPKHFWQTQEPFSIKDIFKTNLN